jgi:hypothetical protein
VLAVLKLKLILTTFAAAIVQYAECRRRGALICRVSKSALRMFTPFSNLTVYEWKSRTAKDYFCPKCGIMPFRIPSAPTENERAAGMLPFEGWAINARCLEDVDLSKVPVKLVDGASLF